MGDRNSSDCSWKKMVIAKANNKWMSTMKPEQCVMDNSISDLVIAELHTDTEHITFSNVKTDFMNIKNIKTEREESVLDDIYQTEESMSMSPDMDPLLLEPGQRRRRKGSGLKSETSDERAMRLAKMSAYAAQRLANESPEQRATRLRRMSQYAAKRLAHETSEQRARRLSRMSAYAAKRLANESPEQRQARLTRMSAYAAKRQAMKKLTATIHPSTTLGPASLNLNISNVMPNQS